MSSKEKKVVDLLISDSENSDSESEVADIISSDNSDSDSDSDSEPDSGTKTPKNAGNSKDPKSTSAASMTPDALSAAFPSLDSDEEETTSKFLAPEVKRKGNNFPAMGLSKLLLTNIQRTGFKVPTPIQRKSMPMILDGKDVVGMARTGSGKTAAFVIPMIERLRSNVGKPGIKALILSPNRELAMQTYQTVKDLSRKTDLKSCFIVGGDSMEDQFSMIVSSPDIVVATPGRFMHIKVEMGLSLASCEYVVFDEADRLFEMGFQDQLTEILGALPEKRQTLLFSATLPPTLVQFAKAGLNNPQLVRLDAEQKISDQLEMGYFGVKDGDRDAALLYILQSIIKMPLMTEEQRKYLTHRENYDPTTKIKQKRDAEVGHKDLPTEEATIVFVPTKHHVEYVATLLKQEGYAVSYIYGALDQAARREQLYLFRAGKTSVLVVTDVAARGVDIPLLKNVINYNIPTSARVFVHRVGRTARAGHSGWAYTLARQQDLPYLVDLEVFLGRKIRCGDCKDYSQSLVLGSLPQSGIESCAEKVQNFLSRDSDDLRNLQQVAIRGEKMYSRSREAASRSSLVKAKQNLIETGDWEKLHPLVHHLAPEVAEEEAKDAMLARLNSKRVKETVFEFKKTLDGDAAQMMARRRKQIAPIQERLRKKQMAQQAEREMAAASARAEKLEAVDLEDRPHNFRDNEFYMSHFEPIESTQERGYNFRDEADRSAFEISNEGIDYHTKQITRWDKKRGKFVKDQMDGNKFIRGENGAKIPASLKSGRFDAWKKAHKITDINNADTSSIPTRRYKHNKVSAPKAADKYRDDYKKRQKRVKEAVDQGVQVKGMAAATSELKSAADIHKQRNAKQKRWDKSNQPGKKRKN
ncbi:putative ATP-dependent RNA helicase [Starmerella bacillaris]|uniref:ATP-dependent RNA helicase DBP10 n=1 Tax=Starmerella bacillaris TaxID=1247836 RepID=A0AAV5RF38_STABA|nr:putative ATP-dependent RNA helicase [Starmerella bacillaris]